MNNIGLLMEYEDILLGKRKDFSSEYIGKATASKEMKELLTYVYEDLLKWSPETIKIHNTPALTEALHLSRPIKKIDFPIGLDPSEDVFYVAHFLYPDKIHYSKKALVLRIYEKVLQGALAKYPKKFFSDAEGELNLNICFQYAVAQKLSIRSIEELYEYFSDRDKGITFLKKTNLYSAFADFYEYPIDILHESLPSFQQNLLCYMNGRLKSEIQAFKKGV